MCKLCNGTHVVHDFDSAVIGYFACPNCGPMSKKQLKHEREVFSKRLADARRKFMKKKLVLEPGKQS